MSKVPGRDNYLPCYLGGGRVFSYAHQIESVMSLKPCKVLEVGIGPGMVAAALRAVGIEVITVDCQAELRPDIVASVTSLPFPDKSFDVALCCQVLEHLPFALFSEAIKELARVSRSDVVLSLPDATPYYEIRLRIPVLGSFHWVGTRWYHVVEEERNKAWSTSGHYWEIGHAETPLKRIIKVIADNNRRIVRTWRVPENPFHRFLVLHVAARH